jgi:hypothetical protein
MPAARRLRLSSGKDGLVPIGYQASAYFAVRRSAGPDSPPTQIGGRRAGLGTNIRLSKSRVFAVEARLIGGPEFLEDGEVFIRHLAALGEGEHRAR